MSEQIDGLFKVIYTKIENNKRHIILKNIETNEEITTNTLSKNRYLKGKVYNISAEITGLYIDKMGATAYDVKNMRKRNKK